MLKAIIKTSVFLLMLLALQPDAGAQIIREKNLTTAKYSCLLQASDHEIIYVGSEGNPESYMYDVSLTKTDLSGDLIWKKIIDWDFDCTVTDAKASPALIFTEPIPSAPTPLMVYCVPATAPEGEVILNFTTRSLSETSVVPITTL